MAATSPISEIEVGQIISINGMKFAKTSIDPVLGSKFMAICESNSCSDIPHCAACSTTNLHECRECESGYMIENGACVSAMMQDWNGCGTLAKPTGTNFTQGPTLIDARDGKSYEIRKFSDGKCWMAENLRYGGGTDGASDYCAGNTTVRDPTSAANTSAVATNGLNPPGGSRNTLVGNCQDAAIGAAISSPCYNSTTRGYYYDWPAAIQNASGWYGNSFQPAQPTQGICPDGWHLPTGNSSGNFQALHTSAGSPSTGFWQRANWQGVFSGHGGPGGSLSWQNSYGLYWSSTQGNSTCAYSLYFTGSGVNATYCDSIRNGFTVRCIAN